MKQAPETPGGENSIEKEVAYVGKEHGPEGS